MNFKSIALWLAALGLLALSYHKYSWAGVAAVGSGLVFWVLLHFSRMMTVLKRAAGQPMGHVASAVMLNAKLKKGVNLLHVMALTRSIGLLQTEKDAQPEIFRWQDAGGSHVTCTLLNGKLQSWVLYRPPVEEHAPEPASPAAQ